jgi:hypothetical protein
MNFYLGTHQVVWFEQLNVPLFVSHRRLSDRRGFPRALAPWALDSGGFSELSLFGEWRTTEAEYVAAIRRYQAEIGWLDFAAPQDWMCEPWIVGKTGLSVPEHQARTVANYLRLRDAAPDLPIIPVLQGWTLEDYRRCVDLYGQAGVDLASVPGTPGSGGKRFCRVGLGSVCRRNTVAFVEDLVAELHDEGVQLHGFGLKLSGLRLFGHQLASADSMAWSYAARRDPPLLGHRHKNCANCADYALAWRDRTLVGYRQPRQVRLPLWALRDEPAVRTEPLTLIGSAQ